MNLLSSSDVAKRFLSMGWTQENHHDRTERSIEKSSTNGCGHSQTGCTLITAGNVQDGMTDCDDNNGVHVPQDDDDDDGDGRLIHYLTRNRRTANNTSVSNVHKIATDHHKDNLTMITRHSTEDNDENHWTAPKTMTNHLSLSTARLIPLDLHLSLSPTETTASITMSQQDDNTDKNHCRHHDVTTLDRDTDTSGPHISTFIAHKNNTKTPSPHEIQFGSVNSNISTTPISTTTITTTSTTTTESIPHTHNDDHGEELYVDGLSVIDSDVSSVISESNFALFTAIANPELVDLENPRNQLPKNEWIPSRKEYRGAEYGERLAKGQSTMRGPILATSTLSPRDDEDVPLLLSSSHQSNEDAHDDNDRGDGHEITDVIHSNHLAPDWKRFASPFNHAKSSSCASSPCVSPSNIMYAQLCVADGDDPQCCCLVEKQEKQLQDQEKRGDCMSTVHTQINAQQPNVPSPPSMSSDSGQQQLIANPQVINTNGKEEHGPIHNSKQSDKRAVIAKSSTQSCPETTIPQEVTSRFAPHTSCSLPTTVVAAAENGVTTMGTIELNHAYITHFKLDLQRDGVRLELSWRTSSHP